MPTAKDFASYGLFETLSGKPLGSINSTETISPAQAKRLALREAAAYQKATRTAVYVVESRIPKMWSTPVPVMKTKVIFGRKR